LLPDRSGARGTACAHRALSKNARENNHVAEEKKRRRRTWIIVVAVVVVVGLIAIVIGTRAHARQLAASNTLTATVARGTVTSSVTATGQLTYQYTYTVAPGVSAVLTQLDGVAVGSSGSSTGSTSSGGATSSGYRTTSLSASVGEAVTTNEKLAVATSVGTSTTDLQAAVTSAQQALDSANSSLSYDQSSYNSLEVARGTTTEALNAALKQISADYVSIDQARAALTTAQEAQSAHTVTVTSPVDGNILAISTAVGASASQVATIGAGNREVSVMVSEYDIPKLVVGQKVALTLGSSLTSFAGTVAKISPQPSDSTGVEQYQVVISSTAIPSYGRIGMTGTASIAIATKHNVLEVPVSAVNSVNGHSTVTVFTARGKKVVTTVTTGLVGDNSIEITSGVTAGEKVVTGVNGTIPATTTKAGKVGRL
jgi:multidrug efflux pump subunit AcrA (membrane-fusion protein)